MTRAWYHIVVVGTDLAGIIFAALAARQGYRVCVIGQGDEPSRYRVDGHWFLREREVFTGVGVSPAIHRVFSELALGLEMKNRPQPLEPTIQLAMPGVRLDFSRESRILDRELEREFPGAADGVAALDEEARTAALAIDPLMQGDFALPPDGFTERLEIRQRLRGIDPWLLESRDQPFAARIAHPGLAHAAHAAVDHLAGLGTETLPRHVAMRLWRALRGGIHRFPGGLDGLKQMFIRKLQDQSGDYRADALGVSVDVKRHRAVSVGLAERGEGLGCEIVVLNAPPDRIGPLFGVPVEPARAHRAIVNIAVDPRVIPPSMAPELLLFADDDHHTHAPGWWVSRPGAGPHAGAEGRPGPGVIQMSTPVRGHRLPALVEDPGFLRTEALRALRTVMPWLDEGLRAVDIPPPRPLLHHLDPDSAFTFGLPWATLPLSNALATSAGHVSPLGLEGACLSALVALVRLKRRLKIKGALPDARL